MAIVLGCERRDVRVPRKLRKAEEDAVTKPPEVINANNSSLNTSIKILQVFCRTCIMQYEHAFSSASYTRENHRCCSLLLVVKSNCTLSPYDVISTIRRGSIYATLL